MEPSAQFICDYLEGLLKLEVCLSLRRNTWNMNYNWNKMKTELTTLKRISTSHSERVSVSVAEGQREIYLLQLIYSSDLSQEKTEIQ